MAERRGLIPERPAIGIDIGGTKIAAGVVDEDGNVIARARRQTPGTDRALVLDAIADVTAELRELHPTVRAVGIGAAGFVDASQSTVVFAPHLAWRHEPLRDAASRRVGLPVLVDNDANCAGWAEYRFGAAQNQSDVVIITLGTGIGGAIVLDGQPYRGQYGIAGEFGHMQVVPDGRDCPCGQNGCWEQYASGRVLTRRAREAAEARTPLGLRFLEEAGSLEDVTGYLVTAAAMEGDEQSREWIADVGHWLGIGIANLAAALDPGLFVIGGGASDARELLLDPARAAFGQRLTGRGFRAEALVVRAHLGPEAGMIGAADMARIAARRRRPRQPGARATVRPRQPGLRARRGTTTRRRRTT